MLDALGLDAVNLVGHDWGGVVGFIVCVEHPDRVAALRADEHRPPLAADRRHGRAQDAAGARLPGAAREPRASGTASARRRSVLGAISKKISTRSDVVMAEVERFSPRFRERPRAKAAQQVYRTFLLHDYPSQVRGRFADKRLTTPTLWLNGVEDPVFSRGAVESVAKHADDVRFEELARLRPLPAAGAPGPRRRAAARVLRGRARALSRRAGAGGCPRCARAGASRPRRRGR